MSSASSTFVGLTHKALSALLSENRAWTEGGRDHDEGVTEPDQECGKSRLNGTALATWVFNRCFWSASGPAAVRQRGAGEPGSACDERSSAVWSYCGDDRRLCWRRGVPERFARQGCRHPVPADECSVGVGEVEKFMRSPSPERLVERRARSRSSSRCHRTDTWDESSPAQARARPCES